MTAAKYSLHKQSGIQGLDGTYKSACMSTLWVIAGLDCCAVSLVSLNVSGART